MTNFDAIRPYNDQESVAAIQRIIASDECLNLIISMKFPRLANFLSWLIRPFFRATLSRKANHIHSVADFQKIVAGYLDAMLAVQTDGVGIHGLENIDFKQPCLFMSNHRDIALDPALVNYAMYQNGADTIRIAIGDNLLTKPFASDLMRTNKSFIVKRSVSGPRELLKTLKNLSAYIWYSLRIDGESVWLAHREGRAKDGLDKTDPAVIKMLTIAKPKTSSLSDYIRELHIVPVSISYQYDPCDALKAHELTTIEQQGSYIKAEHEDIKSIGLGIAGYKGRIDIRFSPALTGDYETAVDVAEALDQTIVSTYQLQSTNLIAYELVYGKPALDSALARLGVPVDQLPDTSSMSRQVFLDRMAMISDGDSLSVLNMYANPLVNRLRLLSAAK
ncbi:MAG: 1-acyl-sn-glycerol-3-phosphate acyltransferase [Pseudomonadales bacterium]|nr:1-acyl-sn-glycerol-3-phosphate acyltransferase [Pseudomonadales bacterium]